MNGIKSVLLGAALSIFAATGLASSSLEGREAPDFVLKSSAGENLRLSELRANSVIQTLVDQGLDPILFSPIGLGSRSPVLTGPALEDGGLERRVSLNVLLQDPRDEAESVRP